MKKINFQKTEMKEIAAHGGKGLIKWNRLVEELPNSNINFIDRALIPPNTSIGKHFHKNSEEIYFIISGHGKMTLGEESFEVEPYDVVINRSDYHGLENCSDEDIEIFVIEIKSPMNWITK